VCLARGANAAERTSAGVIAVRREPTWEQHVNNESDEVVMINLVKVRDGVDPARFADFAAAIDLPIWRSKDVVLRFDTYRVAEDEGLGFGPEFVEIIHVRSLAEWEAVGETDPDIAPLARVFTELVDEAQVQRIHLLPVEFG
jgi:hypothetical protein